MHNTNRTRLSKNFLILHLAKRIGEGYAALTLGVRHGDAEIIPARPDLARTSGGMR